VGAYHWVLASLAITIVSVPLVSKLLNGRRQQSNSVGNVGMNNYPL
jgi:hypothetical protein